MKKKAVKKAAAVNTTEVKKAAVTTEAVKAAPEKEADKKVEAEVKAPAAKKETAAKTPAAKKETAAKTTAAKKEAEPKHGYVLQFAGKDYELDTLYQNAKNVWVYDLGKKLEDIKELQLYIKPEEKKVYFVVNDKDTASFDM